MPRIKYSKEMLEPIVQSSTSYAQVIVKLGLKPGNGGTQAVIKNKIKEFEIDIGHFKGQGWNLGLTLSRKPYEEIFCENSTSARSSIRKRILSEELIPYECSLCKNIGEWQGSEMPLELDHINNINDDHRLSNLRFLCPNCHSQTINFRGRNTTKALLTEDDYIKAIQENRNQTEALKSLNLNPNGGNVERIKKIVKKFNLKFNVRV